MITNADITIFNKHYDRERREDIFLPTVIRGVTLYMKSGSSGDYNDRESSAAYKIRIPIDADMGSSSFVDWIAYRGMVRDDAANHWTLQADAVIIPVAMEVSELPDIINLSDLTKKYGTFITVTDYSDNTTRGIQRMKHWRIGGV